MGETGAKSTTTDWPMQGGSHACRTVTDSVQDGTEMVMQDGTEVAVRHGGHGRLQANGTAGRDKVSGRDGARPQAFADAADG